MRWLVTLMTLAVASGAFAQDDDWDVIRLPDRQTVAAVAEFDNGLTIGVRCINNSLETVIGGLPRASRRSEFRQIDYAFGEGELRPSTWWVSQDRDAIFANFPAGMARQLREGGELQLRIGSYGDEPARRYVVPVPPSPAMIDEVLTACGRPLVDRRDTLRTDLAGPVPAGFNWVDAPRPEYPVEMSERGVAAVVVLSCALQSDGALKECQVEAERPGGRGFGQAAVRAAEVARVAPRNAGAEIADRIVNFTTFFRPRR